MKNLELELMGVQEMDAKEMRSVDGGVHPVLIGLAIGGLVIAFGIGVYNGYQEQKEAAENK